MQSGNKVLVKGKGHIASSPMCIQQLLPFVDKRKKMWHSHKFGNK